jgi:hypothetical protein
MTAHLSFLISKFGFKGFHQTTKNVVLFCIMILRGYDMDWLSKFYAILFSLLLLHEMDAIRTKEWKMFIVLKDMKEQTGYIVFSLIHLPLYAWVIYSVSQTWNGSYALIWLLTDVFLVIHAMIHFGFRKHTANGFQSVYSNILIYGTAALSVLHFFLMFYPLALRAPSIKHSP